MSVFVKKALSKKVVVRSVKVALFVGTVLGVINHYGAIVTGTMTFTNMIQSLITYFVPYSVATYSAVSPEALS